MKLPWSDRSAEDARIERLLRAGSGAFAPVPSVRLRARILAAVHASPVAREPELLLRAGGRESAGTWLAAAAAVLVLVSAWWLTSRANAPRARAASVVALSRGLLDAGTRVLALPGAAEQNMRSEAARLLDDTTRIAEGIVRGLPAPLRERLTEIENL